MVDAWTQTSNRGSDNEEQKDKGIQASKEQSDALGISPTRIPRQDSLVEDRAAIILEQVRPIEHVNSQSLLISHPNRNRSLIPSSQKKALQNFQSPVKAQDLSGIKDRMQAMQIINQYIKDSQMSIKTTPNQNSHSINQDPYNFFNQQPGLQNSHFSSPDKLPFQPSFQYNTEKKQQL